jgi:alkylated DNA repair protein alkB family protein 1
MFHRDLSEPQHKTNIDLHYDLRRPPPGQSFFDLDLDTSVHPKDPNVHKAITIQQLLNKKLRWMTLGGQYDWTRKVYPDEQPPTFPSDLRDLLSGLFPKTTAEAAIVNLYSPGDTLSLHRDVSEDCDRGLISISIGCDCLFILGLDRGEAADEVNALSCTNENDASTKKSDVDYLVLRLRSGDAVYMAGESRFAWHGVPLIIPGTCPAVLNSWPASDPAEIGEHEGKYATWRNWMATKRINLNVRQMRP